MPPAPPGRSQDVPGLGDLQVLLGIEQPPETTTLALAAVFAAITVLIARQAEDARPTPEGVSLAGSVIWRGFFYAAVDGLLRSAFPILVPFAAFAGSPLRERRRYSRHRRGRPRSICAGHRDLSPRPQRLPVEQDPQADEG
jgi:hypothetical protein